MRYPDSMPLLLPRLVPAYPALLVAAALSPAFATAQDALSRAGLSLACPVDRGDTLASVPADAAFLQGQATTLTRFELRFGEDVPAVAQAALRFAADVWGAHLDSPEPVVVDVDWRDRDDPRLLASAGPSTLFRDFAGGRPGVWYPVALAEAIAGRGLNDADDADIRIVVNSEADWYFGTDAAPPRGQTDLVTVALHELGHGLGFISSADTLRGVEAVIGFTGRFLVYDLFLEERGRAVTDPLNFANPGQLLLAALTADELVFAGPTVFDVNGGAPAPMYAPAEFDPGSSVSHFDERSFPTGSSEALMTPSLARGEAIHRPGDLALALLADLGWVVRFDLASGATAPTFARALRAYPSPVSETVWVRDWPADLPARLLDARGAALRVVSPAELLEGLVVDALAAGVYHLVGADGNTGARFVVR